MKIICDRDKLVAALNPVASVASPHSAIPSLACVLMQTQQDGTCLLVGYDLEKGIKTYLPCEIEEEGFFLLNAGRLAQIVRTMPQGNVCLEIDAKTCKTRITGGSSVFELQAQPGSAYPDLPEITSEKGFSMQQEDLVYLLRKTLFAAAVSDPRPSLNGVFLRLHDNTITMVGCDGGRMSVCEKTVSVSVIAEGDGLDFSCIIPSRTADELLRLLGQGETITFRFGRKHILFEMGDIVMFARLIDVDYIEYERFIPKASEIFVNCDRRLLEEALERAMLVTEEKQPGQSKSPVVFRFGDQTLNVSSTSVSGCVNDDLPIQKEGGDIAIAFTCRFLYDAVKTSDADTLRLSLTSPLTGMILEPSEPEEGCRFLMLVNPIRFNL